MKAGAKIWLTAALVGLCGVIHSPVLACNIESAGRTVVSVSDYNPLAEDRQGRDFGIVLRGQPGQIAWLQLRARTSPEVLNLSFLTATSNGRQTVGGSAEQPRPLDPGSLVHFWAPLVFDAQGLADIAVSVVIQPGQLPAAGLLSASLEAVIACEIDGAVRESITPVNLGALEIRVPSLIAVSRRGSRVLDFGIIPLLNPDGYSPQSARSEFDVTATGGFSVQIDNDELVLRNQDIQADGRLDVIDYDVQISDDRGSSVSGPNSQLSCGRAPGGQTLTVAARLFANAASGKLAGRYRDTVRLTVTPIEVSALLAGQCRADTGHRQ